jgi:predicted Fe-Mo cluster-binding NifX family protein
LEIHHKINNLVIAIPAMMLPLMNKETPMKRLRLAVPTNAPGGLHAERSDHFGHCALFTIIDLEGEKIVRAETIGNISHEVGGCLVPVKLLQEQEVGAIVVGGMGKRPLLGFQEAGIAVYFAPQREYLDVRSVVEGMLAGAFQVMDPQQACKGGGDCHR